MGKRDSVTFLALQSQRVWRSGLGWLGFAIFQVRGRETLSGASLALVLIKPQLAIVAIALWVASETGALPSACEAFETLTIPIAPEVESLNVTVAASLLLSAAAQSRGRAR